MVNVVKATPLRPHSLSSMASFASARALARLGEGYEILLKLYASRDVKCACLPIILVISPLKATLMTGTKHCLQKSTELLAVGHHSTSAYKLASNLANSSKCCLLA